MRFKLLVFICSFLSINIRPMTIQEAINAAYGGDLKRVLEFLNEGNNVNSSNDLGETLLHRAAQGRKIYIVEMLILRGANLNAFMGLKMTPLHYAASSDASLPIKTDIIKLLLKHGADPSLLDNWGQKAEAQTDTYEIKKLLRDAEKMKQQKAKLIVAEQASDSDKKES